MTEGEYRVGITFNPSGDADVDRIKELSSQLIDIIEQCGKDERCTSLAQTAFEEGAMWAVKSITKKPRS